MKDVTIKISGCNCCDTTFETEPCQCDSSNVNGRSPYIGDNGNWFEWSDETQEFVDTGVRAEGRDGEQGEPGKDGQAGVDPRMDNGAIKLFVSQQTGSDTAGDGREENPFATIGKVANFYNSLVGVSNCTVSLMDGDYDYLGQISFYVRGNLTLNSSSADRSKVTVKRTGIFFYGGSVNVTNLTFDLSGNTSLEGAIRPNRCFSTITNSNFKGTTLYNTRGVWTSTANVFVSDCDFSDMYTPIVAENGTTTATNLSGKNNIVGYYAHGSHIIVNNNSMVANMMKKEDNNGEVRGIS